MWQSRRILSDLNVSTTTTTKIRRFIFRCFLIIITMIVMSMSSMMRRNIIFSNAFISSRTNARNHHRHTSMISSTLNKHQLSAISIPISNTRSSSVRNSQQQQQQQYHHRSFSINNHPHSILQQQQQSYIQSTTSLAAAATATATSGRRSKSFSKNYSLVVHGPPGFIFPLPKKKDKLKQQQRPFKLVIVESPSKCLTISKILQQYVKENDLNYDFVITSSMGHIRNIPKDKSSKDQIVAGIDLDNDYQPSYTIIEGKENLTRELQELSASAQQLVLATDDDREGEAMAWHLLQLLEGDGNDIITITKNTKEAPLRVRFTEITRKAIVDAIEHPETSLRDNLVQAQETRRVLDRLAGFTVYPILWKKIVS